MEFVWYLVLILLFTKLAGDLSVRLGQPAVLGKLIVGILLGPAVLGWIDSNEFIHYVSEVGVLLLMFIAGLETVVEQLKKIWKSAVAVAVGGIILPFIGGYGVAELFGFSVNYALFMGVLFSATSVSISVQVLKDLDRLGSKEGTTILGAAVVDDILVVILLAFMMSFLGTGQEISMGLLIGKKVLFFDWKLQNLRICLVKLTGNESSIKQWRQPTNEIGCLCSFAVCLILSRDKNMFPLKSLL